MTDTTDQQAVTVEQEDREAATLYWQSQDIGSPETYAQIRAGRRDDSHLIRAFARHRLASVSSASAEGGSGMKTWLGGDAAPIDWDGGPVLYRNGVIANVAFSARWLRGFYEAEDDIIAYTPEPVPATNQSGEVATFVQLLRNRADSRDQMGYDATAEQIREAADMIERLAALATQPATSQEGEAVATAKARLSIAAVKARNRGAERGAVEVIADDVAVLLAAHSDLDRQLSALATQPATSQEGEREAIARMIALAGLGTINGQPREPHGEWTREDFEARILTIIPTSCEQQCFALADRILAATPTPPTLSEDLRALIVVTDAKGFVTLHEPDEDGNAGDLVASVWRDDWLPALANAQVLK